MNGLVEHIVRHPINYFPNGVKIESVRMVVISNSLFGLIHGLIKTSNWGLLPITYAQDSNQGHRHLHLKFEKYKVVTNIVSYKLIMKFESTKKIMF